ncbi:LOW QUALITY PROTEIN: hypothetical protein MSG28_014030 [Choristoneura fumiferana]|uniref:Uncharacterized protein n=1 Tax=Choristoneura fumiferana TaxID=7141 RepID=A0ACC0JFK6_CHOFU|nr:LOW QUALITY PROTEIN: hypothetical protein MSG28_014030 [Choristoneura fumiferana]
MNSQGDEDEKHPVTKHHNRPQTRERATRLARGAGLAACARAALFTAAAADAGSWSQTRMKTARIAENSSGNLIHIIIRTNILERYYNEDVRLTLPEGKRVSRLKWFAVYDIQSQNAFADVYVPEDFAAPAPLAAGALAGQGVTSGALQLLDAGTILRPVDQTVPAPAPLAAGALAGQGVTSAPLQLLDAGTILRPDRTSARAARRRRLAGQGVTSAPLQLLEAGTILPYQRPRRSPPAPWPDRASPARPYSCWTLAPYCEWTSRPVDQTVPAPAPLAAGALAGQGVTSAPLQLLDAGTILPYQRPRRSPPAPWPDRASPARPYSCWTLAPYCEWTSRPVDQTVPAPAPLAAGALAGQGVTSAPYSCWTLAPYCEWTSRPVDQTVPAPAPLAAGALAGQGVTSAPLQLLDAGTILRPVDQTVPAPAPLAAGSLAGRGVTSAPLQLLDAGTILIPELHYDGHGEEVYFWAGVGPQPSPRGFKIPDEYGYLEPIPTYRGGAVRLVLPGNQTVFSISWLALWDAAARSAIAAVLLPSGPTCRRAHRPAPAQVRGAGGALGGPPPAAPSPPCCCPSGPTCRPRSQTCTRTGEGGGGALGGPRPSAPSPPCCCQRPNVPPALTDLHPHRGAGALGGAAARSAIAAVLLPGGPTCRPRSQTCTRTGEGGGGRWGGPPPAAPSPPCCCPSGPMPPALTDLHPHRGGGGAGGAAARSAIAAVLLPERPNVPPALTDLHPHSAIAAVLPRAAQRAARAHRPAPAQVRGGGGALGGGRRRSAIAAVLLPERPTCARAHRPAPAQVRGGAGGRWGGRRPQRHRRRAAARAAQRAARAHRPAPAQVRGGGALGGAAARSAIAAVLLPERPNVPPALTDLHPHSEGGGRGGAGGGRRPQRHRRRAAARAAQRAARAHRPAPAQVRGGGGALGGPPRSAIAAVLLPERPNVPPALTDLHPPQGGGGGLGGGRRRSAIAAVLLPERPNVRRPRSQTCTRTGGAGGAGGGAARSAIAAVLLPERPQVRPRSRPAPAQVRGGGGALGGPPPAAAIAAVLLPERPNVPPALTDLHPHTGPLCVAEHPAGADRRRDTDYDTFRAFNRSLVWRCDPDGAPDAAPAAPAAPASPATLAVAPNDTWPDVVYYNSFTHAVTLFSNYDSPIFNSKFPSKNFNAAIREKYSVTTSQQNKGAGPKTRMKTARIAENSSGNLIHIIISYDGTGDDTFFWAGDSARPGPQGFIVPDHHGKTNILERYYNEDVRLTLPEGKRVSRLKWFAVYDIQSQNAFADVYVPEDFAAPAPLAAGALAGQGVTSAPLQLLDAGTILCTTTARRGGLLLGRRGPQPSPRGFKIPDEYGYLEPIPTYRGGAVRLVLRATRPCSASAGWRCGTPPARSAIAAVLLPSGPTCRPRSQTCTRQIDEREYMAFGISGSDNRSLMLGADVAVAHFDARLQRGLATDYNITALAPVLGQWRGVCRDERLGALDSNQSIDRAFPLDRPLLAVWAVGALDAAGEPGFHRLWPRTDLFDPSLRVFEFRVGPAGGARAPPGARALRGAPPEPGVRRQQPALCGGVPPADSERGPARRTGTAAGGRPARRQAGPLCVAEHPAGADRRRDTDYDTFRAFNRSLVWRCDPDGAPAAPAAPASPATLAVAPNDTWPDVVYYNSFTHAGMGGRIFVVDRHRRNINRKGSGAAPLLAAPSPPRRARGPRRLDLPRPLDCHRNISRPCNSVRSRSARLHHLDIKNTAIYFQVVFNYIFLFYHL